MIQIGISEEMIFYLDGTMNLSIKQIIKLKPCSALKKRSFGATLGNDKS